MSTPPSTPSPEPSWGQPWDRPVDEEHNIGTPASTPYSEDRWAPPSPGNGQDSNREQGNRPAFAPPDPAAVSGPPWPDLVAVGHYTPPRMIRWPIGVGLTVLIAVV